MFMPGVWILWSIFFFFFVIIFLKETGSTFTLLIIFIVKSLHKEQNSTNLLLWPLICRNKHAITQNESTPRRLTLQIYHISRHYILKMDLIMNFIFYFRDSNSGPLHHDRSGSSSSSNNNTVGKTKYAYILQNRAATAGKAPNAWGFQYAPIRNN